MGSFGFKHMKMLSGWVDYPFDVKQNYRKKCMGGHGMLCVMCVLDEFDPKEATNLMNPPKCIERMLDEFPYVMPKELPNELPPRKQVDHAIEVMVGMKPLAIK